MKKAKYKIDNLVKLKDESTGIIDCVITFHDRYEYGLAGKKLDESISEDKIVCAYRPIAQKTTKVKAVKGTRREPKPVAVAS